MKLDYLKLLNQFWQLRRSKRITSLQSDLYFFLLHECNMKYWENPFECSNVLIKASIGISEPSLIDARNRLKQLGLIEFQPGKRKEASPVYQLLYLNKLSINRIESLVKPLVETVDNGTPLKTDIKTETKTEPNETLNLIPPSPAVVKPVKKIKKEKAPPDPLWQLLLDVWFKFHEEKFSFKPVFTEKNANELKRILAALKKKSLEKNPEKPWDEIYSAQIFKYFLSKAYNQSQWLQQNFHLHNLYNQINSIINPQNNGTATNKQPTGGQVSTESAFAKFDKMPN